MRHYVGFREIGSHIGTNTNISTDTDISTSIDNNIGTSLTKRVGGFIYTSINIIIIPSS